MRLSDEVTASIPAGDDFYNYVNKRWIDENPTPADKARLAAFDVLSDENTERLHELFEAPAPGDEAANISLLRAFYKAAMDEQAIEVAGLSALQPHIDQVNAVKTPDDILGLITGWHGMGCSLLWSIGIGPDDKDSQRYLPRTNQSGLGLPDRDYYLEDGERFEKIREEYKKFLVSFFKLIEDTDPEGSAQKVYALEEELAKASSTVVEQRDPDAMYNLYSQAQLNESFAGLNWAEYLAGVGLADSNEIIISQTKFLKKALQLVHAEPIEKWKPYLKFHIIRNVMSCLPKAFVDLSFSFYGVILRGTPEQEARYKRIISLCEHIMPQPLGQLYVQSYFDENAKKTIIDLVGDIQVSMKSRIKALDWMGDGTKAQAFEKLGTFLPLLGYPDTWRDYSGIQFGEVHAANVFKVFAAEWRFDTSRVSGPVDRKEWLMSPATVNAYYWSNTNGITFPAGILQPPFFDATGDMAANFGGIGVVIGHEITHGFDDEGSKFDKIGNLKSWWSDEDRAAFDERTKQLKEQYDGYEIEGRHVNGALTLGENVADIGGILIAYDALLRYLEKSGDTELIDGFTPQQRFFMSYARVRRGNFRPEFTYNMLVTDPHSPPIFRVNGVVPNVDAFYEAFDVQPGAKLYQDPVKRVRIW